MKDYTYQDSDFPRAILHIDGDAFFVAVEMAKDPSLRGKAVVTGSERGIVTALSYEAKALGVIRGLPIFQVKKQYPSVIILPGDYESYVSYSSKMIDIVRRYADVVQEYSIDECFADLTGLCPPLHMSYEEIAIRIKKEIRDELHISVSLGIAPTKVLAKVASKWKKPDGLTLVPLSQISSFLKDIPTGAVWGIGPETSIKLSALSVKTALEFANQTQSFVEHYFGRNHIDIWHELRGTLIHEVCGDLKDTYASISKTKTFFPATHDSQFLLSQLSKHTEDACEKARHYHLRARHVSFFLKTKEFRYHRADFPLPNPTNTPEVIFSLIQERIRSVMRSGVLYRTAGVTLHGLIPDSVTQPDLFGNHETIEKREEIYKRIDSIRSKFGKRSIHLASTHQALEGSGKRGKEYEGNDKDLLFL